MKNILILFILLSNISFGQVDLSRGLKAYYPFSGNAKDESGNNNDPVFNNARLTADRFGNAKSAYAFDGKAAYMKILNSPSINTTNKLSLCVWVKPQGFYAGKCHGNAIIMKGDADYLAGNYLIRFDDNLYSNGNNCYQEVDKAHQTFYGMGAFSSSPQKLPYIKTNKWYSVVVTHDGKTSRLYIDCVLVGSHPQQGSTFTNDYDLFLGRLNNDDYPYWFKGDMDDVRVYNRALNEQEIKAICDEEPGVKEPPYVKEKKEIPVKKEAGRKPAKPDSLSEMNPLLAANKQVEFTAGAVDSLNFAKEKEVVLEKRANDLIKEIVCDNDSISITLYDNGVVDGDSITLVYNDKILTTHRLISEKPIAFHIKIAPGDQQNILKMYAENLGSIAPNTALMVIYDGNKRYEVNIRSTEKTNGAVLFKLRE